MANDPPAAAAREQKQNLARLFSATSGDHQRQALFARHGERLVDWASLRTGDDVLDVAAGAGASLVPAARRVGRKARVVGIDIAPGMVAQLSEVIAAEELANASAILGDAEALPFPARSFDAVLCAFGLFFFPDVAAALAEFGRVLRPGGRVAVATFTEAGSRSIDRTWGVLEQHVQVPPPPAGLRRFDDPDSLIEALAGAGFADIELRVEPYLVRLPDVDVWWQWIRSMEFREHVDRLHESAQADLRASAAREFTDPERPPEITFPMDALLARARSD